jgi:Flp pilus assembly protein TadG
VTRPATAATELALVLPVLAILVLGCIDFGRFSTANIAVANAARAGAEFGGTHACTTATAALWEQQVKQAVVDEMSGLDRFDPTRLTVTVTRVTSGTDARVEVDVTYPFDMAVGWPGLPAHLTLERVVSMPLIRL